MFPRRRRPHPVTRRTTLAAVVLAAIALLTVSYRHGDNALSGPQMVVLQVLSPIERGMVRAWSPIGGAWDWSARLLRATNENPRLRTRLDELEQQVAVSRAVERENEDLRDELAMQQRGRYPEGYDKVNGSVISKPPTPIDHSVVIDLGTDNGVAINDPVMVTRGLIGRVEQVSRNTARVGLIINKTQAVSAITESGASGIVRAVSNEGSPVMELAYVPVRVRVGVGDLVYTSGWSTGDLRSIYPKHIPIGVVTSAGNSPADLYKTIQVTPFADFDRIDDVTVLVPTERTRAATQYDEPAATAPAEVAASSKQLRPDEAAERARRRKARAEKRRREAAATQAEGAH